MKGTVQEGFVVRLTNGTRFKIKAEEYLALHRSFARFTPDALWAYLSTSGVSLEVRESSSEKGDLDEAFTQYLLVLPDEFHDEAKALAGPWIEETKAKEAEVVEALKGYGDKREIGMAMKAKTLPMETRGRLGWR